MEQIVEVDKRPSPYQPYQSRYSTKTNNVTNLPTKDCEWIVLT